MAVVRLRLREREVGPLPRVCMKCGAVATSHYSKTFSWFPAWVYLLILNPLLPLVLFVAPLLVRRARVEVPLCEEHRGLWRRYSYVIAVWLLGMYALMMAAMAIGDSPGGREWGEWALLGPAGLVLLLAWIGVAVYWHLRMIRAQEITEHFLILKNVSPEFIRVYETTLTYDSRDLDQAVRERWGQKGRPERREGHVRPPGESDRGREGGEGFTSRCG